MKKLLNTLNKYVASPLGNKIFETNSAHEIHNHYLKNGNRTAAALRPNQEALNNLYQKFFEIEKILPPETLENLELTAEFENGKLIDYSSISAPTKDLSTATFNVLKEQDASPLISSFQNIVKDCIGDDFTIKVFGKNKTGITGWHKDGSDEIVGVLPLKDHDLTTIFRGTLGIEFSSPKHSIVFTGDAEHTNAKSPRPAIHVIGHNTPSQE
ncbi:MAG: hypothetical protein ACRBDI_08700 [Alphaproteobacteria bacterium]